MPVILNNFFNEVFDWCVRLLENWAAALGMTYNEINVWIFCIIWPLAFIIMGFWIMALYISCLLYTSPSPRD